MFGPGELSRQIEELEASIARFDFRLRQQLAREHRALAPLQTLPCVDAIGAVMVLVEIGSDMSGLGNPNRLAARVGICLGNNESAGKRPFGRPRKGNSQVRRLLCQFAHTASGMRSALQTRLQSPIVRRGHEPAIAVLAHTKLRKLSFLHEHGG